MHRAYAANNGYNEPVLQRAGTTTSRYYNEPGTVDIEVTFSESVVVVATTLLSLDDSLGAPLVAASYFAGSAGRFRLELKGG